MIMVYFKSHFSFLFLSTSKTISLNRTYKVILIIIYFDRGTITLKEGCSAIIQRTLPPKTKDLGSATIPCTIGKILLDLGANINLIHFSMVAQIGDSEIKPTRMSLQLADCSIKYPYGVVEDVLMKEDKFVFLFGLLRTWIK